MAIDSEIRALGFKIENNVFDRKEQIEKFSSLINARIEKLRNAKAYCVSTDSRDCDGKCGYAYMPNRQHYDLENKQITIALKLVGNGHFKAKRSVNKDDRLWSVNVPMPISEGRQWEALSDAKKFKTLDTPVFFKIACSKKEGCEFDVISLSYPYIGEDRQWHYYTYLDGTFKSN